MKVAVLTGERPHQFYRHLLFGYGPMGLSSGQGCIENDVEVSNEAVT